MRIVVSELILSQWSSWSFVLSLLWEERQYIYGALRYYCSSVNTERFLILRNKELQICPRFVNGGRFPFRMREGRTLQHTQVLRLEDTQRGVGLAGDKARVGWNKAKPKRLLEMEFGKVSRQGTHAWDQLGVGMKGLEAFCAQGGV